MGEPTLYMSVSHFVEMVSRGSEISQYPEEKKSEEISLVVTNEQERA